MDILNNTPDFEKIISDTDANMFLKNYQDLYQEALLLKPGIILEIGPARGTGTIVLGLAAKQNPIIEKIITFDAFQNSRALKSFDNVEENISDLRNNLKKFDCEKKYYHYGCRPGRHGIDPKIPHFHAGHRCRRSS